MKISNLQLIDEATDEFSLILNEFNRTTTQYPKEKTIHQLFEEMVDSYGNNLAVKAGENKRTYHELNEEANQIARFLRDAGIQPEEIVTVYLSPSIHMMAAVLGILKAGGGYAALNPEFPYERIRHMIEDTRNRIVLSEKQFIKPLNRLQWDCPSLQTIVCLDSEHIWLEKEPLNELMKKDLWDYVGEEALDDISAGGWVNSYTGENLSREVMDEYGDNILHKLKPLLKGNEKVLEIGCSSGISMFRLAPLVKAYVGTDMSTEILKKTEADRKKRGLDNITLISKPAHEIDTLEEENFDVVIMNSVVQCFNGHNYLREVLSKAISLMKTEGMIFLGDIMDLETKDDFIQSLASFREKHNNAKFTTKIDWSNELFLSRSFLEDLAMDFPCVVEVQHSDKIAATDSELSHFRFDTIFRIDKKNEGKSNLKAPKNKQQYDLRTIRQYASGNLTDSNTTSGNLAYVAYTSGSTGKPKGVMIEHKSVVRLVRNTHYIQIQPHDRMTFTAPLSFDASTLEIWGALLNGASLHIVEKDILLTFSEFKEILLREKITLSWLTTPLFQALMDHDATIFANLQTLIVGGDVLLPQYAERVKQVNPALKLINGYGPTENTTFSTSFLVEKADTPHIPIGKPIANSQCYIVKENMQLQPIGIIGELCVAGEGLSRGYLNDPVLTAENFVPNPFIKGTKLYKTGDKAKWLPDGNIAFLGRMDKQVKIRGYRVEPGEIESKILEIKGIQETIVLIKENENGEKYICAYLVATEEILVQNVKDELSLSLPDYMIPDFFLLLEKFPLNRNGKINTKALPDPTEKHLWQGAYRAPHNETEKIIADIWQEILGINDISTDTNFFDIGGHSLKATQVISAIQKKLQVAVSIREMFTNPTIAALAAIVAARDASGFAPIQPVAPVSDYPLSYAQQRLWVLHQFESNQIVYNVPGSYRIQNLNVPAFIKAVHTVVERHEILRTTFTVIDGEPRQKVHSPEIGEFEVIVLDVRKESDPNAVAKQIVHQDAQTPFDLEKGPLLRTQLLRLKDNEYIFIYNIHHIISDGWSLKVLVQDIAILYEAFDREQENPLPPLRIQYKDYAHWQEEQLSSENLQKHWQYWLETLKGKQRPLDMPTDFPRPKIQSFSGGVISFELDIVTSDKIRVLSRQHDTTLFITFLSILHVLFYKYTEQTDIIIGTPVNGRIHKDLENQIGFFVNMLPLRNQLNPADPFIALLQQIKQNTWQAFDHQVYPFDKMINDLGYSRDASRNPLFDIVVTADVNDALHLGRRMAFQKFNDREGDEKNVEVGAFEMDYDIGSKFDLMFRLIDQKNYLEVQIRYNSALFRKTSMELLKERFLMLTKDILAGPEKEIHALSIKIMPETQKNRHTQDLDVDFNF